MVGPVELTPAQHEFFMATVSGAGAWNMGFMIVLRRGRRRSPGVVRSQQCYAITTLCEIVFNNWQMVNGASGCWLPIKLKCVYRSRSQ